MDNSQKESAALNALIQAIKGASIAGFGVLEAEGMAEAVRSAEEAMAGSPQVPGHTLLAVARRNIRHFLAKASFSSNVDRWSASECISVLEAAIDAPLAELAEQQRDVLERSAQAAYKVLQATGHLHGGDPFDNAGEDEQDAMRRVVAAVLTVSKPGTQVEAGGPGPYLDESDSPDSPLWKRLRSIANWLTVLAPNCHMEAAELLLSASDRIKRVVEVGGFTGKPNELHNEIDLIRAVLDGYPSSIARSDALRATENLRAAVNSRTKTAQAGDVPPAAGFDNQMGSPAFEVWAKANDYSLHRDPGSLNYTGDTLHAWWAWRHLTAPPAQGWVVADGQGARWRMWGDSGPEWTSDRDAALHFARRSDAEAFSRDDEDAWLIHPVGAPAQDAAVHQPELPQLPSPAHESVSECGPDYFDASQMRQYARAAIAATGKQPLQVGGVHRDDRMKWFEVRGLAVSIVRNLESFAASQHKAAWCGLLDDSLMFADQIVKGAATIAARHQVPQDPAGHAMFNRHGTLCDFRRFRKDKPYSFTVSDFHKADAHDPDGAPHHGELLCSPPPAKSIDLHRLVPPEWISELIGGQMDDLTPGQAWRQGFNQCRERTLLLVEQALGFPVDQKNDAEPGVSNAR